MSRIHEAVKKAIRAEQPGAVATMSTVEDILSGSYTIATGVPFRTANEDPTNPASSNSDLLQTFPTVDWLPDKKAMLFYSDEIDAPGREQFRSLRTKLYKFREKRELGIVAVASSLSGEGKSFVAGNLAHVLSLQPESKALIIDCDLRRGSITRLLGTRPRPGVAEYLRGEEPLESVIQRGAGSNLFLMPSGARVSDPGELIGSSRLKDMLRRLHLVFDWIVIDTPPAMQFADTGVLADLCDGVLLVVGAGMTPVQIAKQTAHDLREDRILGIVLNRAERSDQAAKYFSYYKEPGD
jgi:capsular exopolysaccharide synthesis family protein